MKKKEIKAALENRLTAYARRMAVMFRDPDPAVRERAVFTLGQGGTDLLRNVAWGLGNITSVPARVDLIALLAGIGRTNRPAALGLLRERIAGSEAPEVRKAAFMAILSSEMWPEGRADSPIDDERLAEIVDWIECIRHD